MLRLDLPRGVTDTLRDAFADMPLLGEGVDALLARLLQISALLPVGVVESLLRFRASPYGDAALLLTGLPVDDDLPPTPSNGQVSPAKRRQISECAALAIAVLLGEPVSYQGEKDGVLVQDVYPTPCERAKPSNESSGTGLAFHTELTFSRAAPEEPLHVGSPDFVLLLGLRCPADRAATTAVVDALSACAALGEDDLALLRAPLFQLRAPYSFTRAGDGDRPWSPPVPLLRGPDDAPSLAFDAACGVRALSPAAERAVRALAHACEAGARTEHVQLRAGDLLAIENTRCAHARSPFIARFDGRDRWLQRVYVRRAIWPRPVASTESFRLLI